MHRFFIEPANIDMENGICRISGSDVNHIGNVLRMKSGEQVLLSSGRKDDPVEYLCEIEEIRKDLVTARILDMLRSAEELPSDLYLFQALPKGDRFETVIEKGVELGVHGIIPVMSARTVVKLDESRARKKTVRWNALALAAAKQSTVGIFIGPEGGFEESEIRQLQELGAEVITLGHRILRTDTAGIAVLSMLMLSLEED